MSSTELHVCARTIHSSPSLKHTWLSTDFCMGTEGCIAIPSGDSTQSLTGVKLLSRAVLSCAELLIPKGDRRSMAVIRSSAVLHWSFVIRSHSRPLLNRTIPDHEYLCLHRLLQFERGKELLWLHEFHFSNSYIWRLVIQVNIQTLEHLANSCVLWMGYSISSQTGCLVGWYVLLVGH